MNLQSLRALQVHTERSRSQKAIKWRLEEGDDKPHAIVVVQTESDLSDLNLPSSRPTTKDKEKLDKRPSKTHGGVKKQVCHEKQSATQVQGYHWMDPESSQLPGTKRLQNVHSVSGFFAHLILRDVNFTCCQRSHKSDTLHYKERLLHDLGVDGPGLDFMTPEHLGGSNVLGDPLERFVRRRLKVLLQFNAERATEKP